MNAQPLVSIVIPTHNRAAMLTRAVHSVLAQSVGDFELIVVSDGSTDNTREVMRSLEDTRVSYHEHDLPRGAAAARNTGIQLSRGRYLAFLDDDDEWLSTKLERQLAVIHDAPPEVGLVYHWIEYLCDSSIVKALRPTLRGHIFPDMLDRQAITNSSTLLIRREVLDIVPGFDETLKRGNDGDFIRRVTKHFCVDYVPEVLCKVHVGHTDRISVNSRQGIRNELMGLKSRLIKFESDFAIYPEKKARVLLKIAQDHINLQEMTLAFSAATHALKASPQLRYKLAILWALSLVIARNCAKQLGRKRYDDSI